MWTEGDIGFFDDLPDPIDLDEDFDDGPDELDFEQPHFDWMEGYDDGALE